LLTILIWKYRNDNHTREENNQSREAVQYTRSIAANKHRAEREEKLLSIDVDFGSNKNEVGSTELQLGRSLNNGFPNL
jgi:hypothetical protein